MVLEITPNAGCVKPTMKQSLTLFLSVLNFFKKNTNHDMTGWERLCVGTFVERKGLMFPKWYERKPYPCTENEPFKILWNFNIQTDNTIEQKSPNCWIYCSRRLPDWNFLTEENWKLSRSKTWTPKVVELNNLHCINSYWCTWNHS